MTGPEAGEKGVVIMIHGNQVSIGCLAMTDEKIEEIYTLCDASLTSGQKFFRVHIFPFRMADERMDKEKSNGWFDFWSEIRDGHDFFEKHRVPPDVTVKGGKHRFRQPR